MALNTKWPPPYLDEFQEEVRTRTIDWWLVEHLLPSDATILVSGFPKKSKKTLAAMELVRCLASGKSMPGIELLNPDPHKILFMEYEGPEGPFAEYWDWMDEGAGWGTTKRNIRVAHKYNHVRLTDSQEVNNVCALVHGEGIKGVVADTFSRAAGCAENDAREVNLAWEALLKIHSATDRGWAMFIHHLTKEANVWESDIDQHVRGSGAFSGSYDHHLAFRDGYRKDSVHLYTRAKTGAECCMRWQWFFDSTKKRIGVTIDRFDVDKPPSVELLHECMGQLFDTNVHRVKELSELWDLPKDATMWVCNTAVNAGMLEPAKTGYRRTK